MDARPSFPTTPREAVSLPAERLDDLIPLTHVNPEVQARIDSVLRVLPSAIVVARQRQLKEVSIYEVPREYGDEERMADLSSIYDESTRVELADRKVRVAALDALEKILQTELEGTNATVQRRQVSSGFRDGKFTDTLFIVFANKEQPTNQAQRS